MDFFPQKSIALKPISACHMRDVKMRRIKGRMDISLKSYGIMGTYFE